MEVNITFLIQLGNALVAVFVIKRWLAIPYLEHYDEQVTSLSKLILETEENRVTSQQMIHDRKLALINFQSSSLQLLQQRAQLLQVAQNEYAHKFKQRTLCALPVKSAEPLEIEKVVELISW